MAAIPNIISAEPLDPMSGQGALDVDETSRHWARMRAAGRGRGGGGGGVGGGGKVLGGGGGGVGRGRGGWLEKENQNAADRGGLGLGRGGGGLGGGREGGIGGWDRPERRSAFGRQPGMGESEGINMWPRERQLEKEERERNENLWDDVVKEGGKEGAGGGGGEGGWTMIFLTTWLKAR